MSWTETLEWDCSFYVYRSIGPQTLPSLGALEHVHPVMHQSLMSQFSGSGISYRRHEFLMAPAEYIDLRIEQEQSLENR